MSNVERRFRMPGSSSRALALLVVIATLAGVAYVSTVSVRAWAQATRSVPSTASNHAAAHTLSQHQIMAAQANTESTWKITPVTTQTQDGEDRRTEATPPEFDEEPDADSTPDDATLRELAQSTYWIGVRCEPASEVLLQQLRAQHGLVVEAVVPESPAAKAGMQRFDVVVTVNSQPVADIAALVRVIESVDGKSAPVELIRAGRRTQMEVTPAKRPAEQLAGITELLQKANEEGKLQPEWKGVLDQLPKVIDQQEMFFVKPALALPGRLGIHRLPEGATLTLTLTADKMAEVELAQDGRRWKVTEDQIDKLPVAVRPYVQQVLSNRSGMVLRPELVDQLIEVQSHPAGAAIPHLERHPQLLTAEELRARLRSQLTELNVELKSLREILPDAPVLQELERQARSLEEEIQRQEDPDSDDGQTDDDGQLDEEQPPRQIVPDPQQIDSRKEPDHAATRRKWGIII